MKYTIYATEKVCKRENLYEEIKRLILASQQYSNDIRIVRRRIEPCREIVFVTARHEKSKRWHFKYKGWLYV